MKEKVDIFEEGDVFRIRYPEQLHPDQTIEHLKHLAKVILQHDILVSYACKLRLIYRPAWKG